MATLTNNENNAGSSDSPILNDRDMHGQAFDEVFDQIGSHKGPPRPTTKPTNVATILRSQREARVDDESMPRSHAAIEADTPDWVGRFLRAFCIGCMLLGAVLFYRGMPSSWQAAISPSSDRPSTSAGATLASSSPGEKRLRTKRIEDVRVGDRLLGRNPMREQVEGVEPNPVTWRKISLHMTKESGLGIWVDLLRPEEWIAEYDIRVGNTVFIDLFEMGIDGDAEVTYVGPCPVIQSGNGAVVTGTFKHQAEPGTKIVHLRVEGQCEPTGVTDNHPYWSVDRQAFVEVGDLRTGELVDTEYGVHRIVSVTPIKHADFLYNLETTEHVYRVGSLGILVHNSCGLARKFEGPIHHIASDKNKAFTPQFRALFNKAGLSLQSPWNRMRVPGHIGPHGQFYNKLVYRRLSTAVGSRTGNAARQALVIELKAIRRDIRYGGWDALLKAPASRIDVLRGF